MNAPVLLAQLAGSPPQTNASAKNLKLEKPQNGQAVTVHLDGSTRLDFSDISSEKLTFVKVGEKLIVLFDNQSTVTVDPVFDSLGRPLADVAFDMAPDRTLTGEEFASLFPITTDQSVLPAAGTPGAPGVPAGAHFGDPSVDPLSTPNPLDLLGPEDLPNVNTNPDTQGVANTVPTAGQHFRVVLDEDAIPGAHGNPGGPGDIDAPSVFSGVLPHDYVSNGPGTIDFAAMNGKTQTINGIAVTFTWDAATNTLTGNDGTHDVFHLVLSDPVNGNFTVTLDHALMHHTNALADNVEGNNTFVLSFTVHDSNGDSADGSVDLVINDDTPTATDSAPQDTTTTIPGEGDNNPIVVTTSATLDDEGQPGGNQDPTYTQPGDVSGHATSVSGTLNFSPGADGLGSIAFTNQAGVPAISVTDSAGHAVPQLQAIWIDGNGVAQVENVTVSWDAATGTLTGTSAHHTGIGGDSPVFTLTLDASGNYTFTADAALAHPLTSDPSSEGTGISFEDTLNLAITYTVTDGDGDKASANLTIKVNDDSPVAFDSEATPENDGGDGPSERVFVSDDVPQTPHVVLDDEDQTGGNQGGPGDDGSGTVATGQLNFSAGADGVHQISITNASGEPALTVTDSNGNTVADLQAIWVDSNGVGHKESLHLVWEADSAGGGTLKAVTTDGHFDTNPAFTIDVDVHGNFTFTANTSLAHPLQGDEGSTAYEDNLNLSFAYTVTDGDGDKASAHLAINIDDDVPTISFGESAASVVLDESAGLQTDVASSGIPAAALTAFNGLLNLGSDPDVAHDNGAISFATSKGSLVSADVSFGADGAATTGALVYSLALGAADGESHLVDSGLKTTDGHEIYLFNENGVIVGRIDGDNNGVAAFGSAADVAAFAIAIDPATGQVSVAQYLSLQHPNQAVAGNGYTSYDEIVSLAESSVQVTVTATDGDGDTVSNSTDVSGAIQFHDDGPTLTVATPDSVTNSFLFDGFAENGNSWGNGSGIAAGTAGAWTIATSGNANDGPGAVQLERVGDGYQGMHSSTNGFMIDLDASARDVKVSQTIGGLTLHESYVLTFEAGAPFTGATAHMQVWFGGQMVYDLTPTGTMQTYSVELFGGSGNGSNLLEFRETGTPDNQGTYLANVKMADVIVIDETPGQQADSNEPTTPADIAAVKAHFTGVVSSVGGVGVDPDMPAQYATGHAAAVVVTANFGADGPAGGNAGNATVYSLSIGNVDSGLSTTAGKPIQLFLENGIVVGRYDSNNDGSVTLADKAAIAFTIDSHTGVVSVAQYVSLHQPDITSNDEGIYLKTGALSATVTITDGDGDAASQSADISQEIRFEDDGPSIIGSVIRNTVDEDDISTPYAQGTSPNDGNGDGSYTNSPNDNTPGPADVTGTLAGHVNFGADGAAASNAYSFLGNAVATMTALGLTSHDHSLSYVVSGNVLTAFVDTGAHPDGVLGAGEHAVFTLTLNGSTGAYTFNLFDSLDHTSGGGQNTTLESTNPGSVSQIDFGSVLQATDGDGDSVALTGQLIIKITDDVPSVHVNTGSDSNVLLTTQDADTIGTASDTSVSSANFGGVFSFTSAYGADGPGQIVKSFTLDVTGQSHNGRVDSGLDSHGASIYLYERNDGSIVGSTSLSSSGINAGNTIFQVAVDATGVVTLTQYAQIDHSDPGQTQGPYDHQYDVLDSHLISLTETVTITDGDGDSDTSSASVDLGGNIRFADDGPSVTVTAVGAGATLTTQDDDTIGSAFDTSTGNFASAFATVSSYGADGPGSTSTSYALHVTGTPQAGHVDSGFSSAGHEIYLYEKNGVIVGSTSTTSNGANSGNTIFQVSVDGNGNVTLTQYAQIDHAGPGETQGPYNDQLATLADHLISLTKTVTLTDYDDDQATSSASIDLGGNISFADDGPHAGIVVQANLIIDETAGQDAGTQDVAHGAGAAVLALFSSTYGTPIEVAQTAGAAFNISSTTYGADGAGTPLPVYALNVSSAGVDSGLDATDGRSIFLYKEGDVIVGREGTSGGVADASGNVAFAISLNSATGVLTVAEYTALSHPNAADPNEAGNPLTLIANAVQASVTVTDGDGDHSTASIDLSGQIKFRDDGPTVLPAGFNLATNGDFTDGGWSPPAFWGSSAPQGSVPGWSLSGDPTDNPSSIQFERQANGFLGLTSSTGNGMIDLGASPGNYDLAQTFNTPGHTMVAGQQYTIAFEAGAPFPQTALLAVYWGNTEIGIIDTTDSHGALDKYSYTVTASGTSSDTLTFREIGDGHAPLGGDLQDEGYHGTYIANVRVLAVNAVVDEDGLNNSQAHGVGDSNQIGDAPTNSATASGDLGINWGADNYDVADVGGVQDSVGRSLTFTNATVAVDGTSILKSDGATVLFQLVDNNTRLVGYVDNGTGGKGYQLSDRLVFEVKLSDDGTGSFQFTLHDNIDHAPGGSENDITLGFNFTAKDSDGDTATGNFIIGVDDDMPVLIKAADSVSVDESLLPTDSHPTGITQAQTGFLHINWGADNGDAKHLEFVKDHNGKVVGPSLTSDGVALDYYVREAPDSPGNEQLIAVKHGADPTVESNFVFSVTLYEQGEGYYTFALYQNIDQPGVGADTVVLNFGVNAYDSDGDAVQTALTVNVTDDVPHAAIAATSTTVTIDETAGDQANDILGATNLPVPAAFAAILATPIEVAQSTAAIVTSAASTFGADGGTSAVFGLNLSATTGVDSGLHATDGNAIYLFKLGDLIVGREGVADASGAIAFAISIDSSTGYLTVAQYTAIQHPDHTDPNDAQSILTNAIQATVTITDGDGDHSAASVGIGGQITFLDDAPTVVSPVQLITNGSFETGLDGLPSGQWGLYHTIDGWTTPAGPAGTVVPFEVQSGNVAGLPAEDGFAKVELDSDPNGATSQFGTHTAPDGGTDHYNDSGHTNATIQQTVHTEAGQSYVLTFWYAPRAGEGNPDSGSINVLWNGATVQAVNSTGVTEGQWQQLTVVVTGTGNSLGDVLGFQGAGQENSLGGFIDNVSLIAAVAVDEDGLPAGNHDSQLTDVVVPNSDHDNNEATATGLLNIKWGADNFDVADTAAGSGFAQDSSGRNVKFTNETVTVTGGALTSHGDVVTVAYADASHTLLVGTAVHDGQSRTVFEVSLSDDGTGAFRFILKDALDHATGNNENNITLSFNFTATDSDGDSAPGSFLVLVNDDTPVAVSDTNAVNEGAPLLVVDAAHGVVINDHAGADGYAATGAVVGVRAAAGDTTSSVSGGVDGTIAGQYGNLVLHADGSYTYKSTANGTTADSVDTFVYTIKDADGDLSTTTLSISVKDSQLVASSDESVKVYEKALDTHALPDGSDLAVSTVTGSLPNDPGETGTSRVASTGGFGGKTYALLNGNTLVTDLVGTYGTIHLSNDGTYVYTLTKPVTGSSADNGADTVAQAETFTYQVTDANGNTSTSHIYIDVVDDTPTARNDSDSTSGASATGNVISGLSTDNAAAGADTVGADGASVAGVVAGNSGTSLVDANTVGSGHIIHGTYGDLTINANGDYTYSRAATSIDAATDVFTYTLKDGDGDLSHATLTINLPQQDLLVVGSTADDTSAANALHVVPSPIANHGVVSGEGGNDILVGDPGGATAAVAGKVANFVFVLDASGSIDDALTLMKNSVDNMLTSLGGSHAQDVRIHLVSFSDTASDLGTFDIIHNGVLNSSALASAISAVNGISTDDGTNYEAALQQALLYIQGGTTTINVDAQLSSFDANTATTSGSDDTAVIIGHGSTQIALVSGWTAPGTAASQLEDVNGSINNGFGVNDFQVDNGELLRFDFGAFTDFDAAGTYNNVGTFNGIPVVSATFTLDDNSSGATHFAYTIHFVGGATQSGTSTVNGDEDVTLSGTGGNTGHQIDYIEFSVTGTNEHGDVKLDSVTTTVSPGTLPNADVNQVVFLSDGEPNEAVDANGNPTDVSSAEAIKQILGTSSSDSVSEVGAIQTNSGGLDQAFTIQAFGLNTSPGDLTTLGNVEGSGGTATNLTNANDLTNAYTGVITGLAGIPAGVVAAGSDTIVGKGGNDVIYGDVLNTDVLSAAVHSGLAAGSGWAVFAALESHSVVGYETWTRADTLTYIQNHQVELAVESGRSGGNDTITGGSGDDVIYGQEGNDIITAGTGSDQIHGGSGNDTINYTTGDGNDVVDGGAGSDTLVISNVGGAAQTFNIGTITGGAEITPITGTNATDIQVSYNGGASTIRVDEIEDIVINLGSNGDTVHVTSSLNGTALDVSTINIVGGVGNDTVDLTGRGAGDIHHVIADGGNNGAAGDTVKLDFAYSAITSVVAVANGFQISHNGITDTFTNFENFQFTDVTQTYSDLVAGPSAPSISSVVDNVQLFTGNVTSGGLTNDPTLDVTISLAGTGALAGDKVQLYDGTTAIGGLVTLTAADITGNSITLTTPSLADGTHNLNAKVSDLFNHTSTASSNFTVVEDQSAPSKPLITGFDTDTGTTGDHLTNDTSLVIKGTAVANSLVTVYQDNVALGTTTSNGSGVWSFTDNNVLSNGNTYQFTATVSDTAGNTSAASTPYAVTVDTTADAGGNLAVVINDGDGYINNSEKGSVSYTLSGLDNDATATVTFTSTGGGSVTVNNLTGNSAHTVNLGSLGDGTITATVSATDPATNTANGIGDTSVKDTTADATPGLAVSFTDGDGFINNSEKSAVGYSISGLDSDATATVTFKSSNGSATVTVNGIHGNGAQSAIDLSGLNDGTITATVTVTDNAANTATGNSDTSTKDTVAPTGGTLGLNNFSDSGSTNTPPVTTDNSFSLSLSGEGAGTTTYQKSTDGGATWTTTNTSQSNLADGDYLFRATTTDAAGNAGVSTIREVIVDNTKPTIGISTSIGTDTGLTSTISSGGLTKDGTLALTGTVGDLNGVASVQVYDGGNLLGSAAVSGGTWSYTTSALGTGNHSFTAVATDNVGNTQTSAAVTANVDVTPPTVTVNTVAGNDIINAAEQAATVTVTGTKEAGSTVTLNGDAVVADTATTWHYTLSSAAITGLGQGAESLQVIATDAAGNTTTVNKSITVDTVAPTVAVNTVAGNDIINAAEKAATVTVTGTNESGSTVTLNGNAVVADTATTWHYTLSSTAIGNFGQGADTLVVVATDAAGNATTVNKGITIDTVAPTVAVNTVAGNDVINAAEQAATVTVSGTNEAGSTVTLNGSAVVADTSTTWHYTLSSAAITGLGQGADSLQVIATDAAGNTTTVNKAITVDTVAPTVTVNTVAGNDIINAAEQAATVTVSGTNESGSTVTLNGNAVVADTATTWHYTLSSAAITGLGQGADSLQVIATDAAGNTTTVNKAITVDTVAPTAPSISVIDDIGSIQGTLADGAKTDDTQLTVHVSLSGTGAVAGDSVQLYDGSAALGTAVVLTALDITNGTIDLTTPTLANNTSHDLRAGVIDAAGNAGALSASGTHDVTIDTTAPTVTITMSDSALTVGETSTVTFAFSEAVTNFDSSDVTVENGTLGALTTSNGGVTWTATFTPTANISDATNVVSVGSAYNDVAGNAGTVGSSLNYTINTSANHAPVLDATKSVALANEANQDGLTTGTNVSVNGGFEGSLNGWTPSGSGTVFLSNSEHSGNNAAALTGQTAGTLSQTFTTVVGQQYVVTYWVASNYGPDSSNNGGKVDLKLNGTSVWTVSGIQALNGGGLDYTEASTTITATSTSTTLSFVLSDTSSTKTVYLDDVTIKPVTIPAGVGTLVSSIVGIGTGPANVTDADAGAVAGVAITTAANTLDGSWYYQLAGSSTWVPFGTVSATAALLLPPDAKIYFEQSQSNNSGTGTMTFRAWDETSGTAGSKADTTVNGNATAFSAVTDTASFTLGTPNFGTTAALTISTADSVFFASGTNTVTATVNNMTSGNPSSSRTQLSATDSLLGAGHDKLVLTVNNNGTGTGYAFNFGAMTGGGAFTGFDQVVVAASPLKSVALTFGNANILSGQTMTIDGSLTTSSTNTFAVDASLVTDGGNFAFVAGGFASNSFKGGTGDDIFDFTAAQFTGGAVTHTVAGGAGNDAIVITDHAATVTITDAAFLNVTGVEKIVLSDSTNTITLGTNANTDVTTAVGNTLTIDGSAASASHNLTVDASSTSFAIAEHLNIVGGAGNDLIKLYNAHFNGNETINGNGGNDTIEITDGGAIADSAFTHISGIETLLIDTSASITLGNFATAEIGTGTLTVDGRSSTQLNVDGSSVGAAAHLNLLGSTNGDILIGGAGDDTITGGKGADQLTGNGGVNTFKWLLGDANGLDTILDFKTGSGGDVLDLSGLLGNAPGSKSDDVRFLYNGGSTHVASADGTAPPSVDGDVTVQVQLTSGNWTSVATIHDAGPNLSAGSEVIKMILDSSGSHNYHV
jgi:T1SS-143 domain-containing protein